MASVFVSFTQADRGWAELIVEVLESAGHQVEYQHQETWRGQNFMLRMHEALTSSDHTVLVLSRAALSSDHVLAEAFAALVRDPLSRSQRLVLVRVDDVQPTGLLGPIRYIDFVGRDRHTMKAELLSALGTPIARGSSSSRAIEAPPSRASLRPAPVTFPPLPLTGPQRSKAVRELLAELKVFFRHGLDDLIAQGADVDFDDIDARTFRCTVSRAGRDLRCKVWIGNSLGSSEAILFNETGSDNSVNEQLVLAGDASADAPTYDAILGSSFGSGIKTKSLSREEALHFLWNRFTEVLRYR